MLALAVFSILLLPGVHASLPAITAPGGDIQPGSVVWINLTGDLAGSVLEIRSPIRSYSYTTLVSQVRFVPSEVGWHEVLLYSGGDLAGNASFYVGNRDPGLQPAFIADAPGPGIYTDKAAYALGDEVRITLVNVNLTPQHSLYLNTSGRSYRFFSLHEGMLSFLPAQPGDYSLSLMDMDSTQAVAFFTVTQAAAAPVPGQNMEVTGDGNGSSISSLPVGAAAAPPSQEGLGAGGDQVQPASGPSQDAGSISYTEIPSGSLKVIGRNNRQRAYRIYVRDSMPGPSVNNPLAQAASAQGRQEDIIIMLNDSAASTISLSNVTGLAQSTFRIETYALPSKIGGKKAIATYGIDATGMNFSSGSMNLTAAGTELWKCPEWDFEGQACLGQWNKIKDLVPGQRYSIALYPGDPGYTETGVAAINSDKPIYHPGEEAKLAIVVLDNSGYLLSGAAVSLSIRSPLNATYELSTIQGAIIETSRGIYRVSFSDTGAEGNYSLRVTALGPGANSTMYSNFLVMQDYDFDILRSLPDSADPWKGPVESIIRIRPHIDVGSVNYSEYLPSSFSVVDPGGGYVSSEGERTVISWSGLNGSAELRYRVQLPLVTPDLYELGPGRISYLEPLIGSYKEFYEARLWFLAVDPAVVSPVTSLSFYLNDYAVGRAGNTYGPIDNNDFDEIPIEMNDYSDNNEKCEAWDCTAWTAGTIDTRGVYCTGGYRCTAWNGNSCDTWSCQRWTQHTTNGQLRYCSGAWDCTAYNGNTCGLWNCTAWASGIAETDRFCTGAWDCAAWSGDSCDQWDCTAWGDAPGTRRDNYCSGGWSCSAWTGSYCDQWGCGAWTAGGLRVDLYCSGQWNCTGWNGNVCSGWGCTAWSSGAQDNDEYCDNWLCTAWDSSRKVCSNWECQLWTTGTTERDLYCSGSWDCTSWKDFNKPPNVTGLAYPQDQANISASSVDFNFTAIEDYFSIQNCSLYMNISGWTIRATRYNISNGTNSNISLYLDDGRYLWNIRCYDNGTAARDGWHSSNYTLTVDTRAPSLNITSLENLSLITTSAFILSADSVENLTEVQSVRFFYRRLPSDAPAFACEDSRAPYQCTWNLTDLEENDSYQVMAFVNDTAGNIRNHSVFNVSFNRPPNVTVIAPLGGFFNLTDNISISINAADLNGIADAYVNLTNPAGEVIRISLAPAGAGAYNSTYLNLTLRGAYNLTYVIVDAKGLMNRTNAVQFHRLAPQGKVIDLVDAGRDYTGYAVTVIANSSGVLTLRINPANHKVKEILLAGHSENSPYSIIKVENRSGDQDFTDAGFMIDASGINMSYANVTFASTGYHLLKCADYNQTSMKCNDEYETLMYGLPEGSNFTIMINATDPGFGQTLQGPGNSTDSYLRQGSANTNYGGATNIRVGKRVANDAYRGIVWFNLTKMPSGIRVVSANLSLYFYAIVSGDALGNRTHGVHRIQQSPARPWTESAVSWNRYNSSNAWTSAGGDYSAAATDTKTFNNSFLNSWIAYNVTPDAQAFVDNQSSNFGWIIRDEDESTTYTRRDYRSSEFATVSLRPKLDIYYEDILAPSLALDLPGNNTFLAAGDVTLLYNVSDNIGLANCSLFLDGALNATNTTIFNGYSNNFTLSGLPQGRYGWSVTCFDAGGLSNETGDRTFYVDATMPAINLTGPADQEMLGANINFTFTVLDNVDAELNCSLMINRTINQTDIVAYNGTLVSIEKSFNVEGRYYWNISCSDGASNLNISATRSFIVRTSVASTAGISAVPNYTGIGQRIIISANVTDPDGIQFVRANITKPGENEIIEMANVGGDKYQAVFNNTWRLGTYNLTIWTRNALGNDNVSSSFSFTINSTSGMDLRTALDIYGPNTDVNLTKADSTWWNSSYIYRQRINLSVASGSTPRDYQFNLRLNSTNVGAGFDWSRSCEDIRFVNASDRAPLSFWIENCSSATESASVWVKVRSNITSTPLSIYMYYGNPDVKNASDGTGTFDFFEDFSGDLSKWTVEITSGVYPRIENQYLVSGGGSTTAPYGHTSLGSNATYKGFQDGIIDGRIYLSANAIAEIAFRGEYGGNTGYKGRMDARAGQGLSFLTPPYSGWGFVAGCTVTGTPPATGTWLDFYMSASGNSFNVTVGTLSRVCTDSTYSSAGEIAFQNHYGSYTYYDDIRVRKLSSSVPSAIIYSEESQAGSSLRNAGATNISGYLLLAIDSNASGSWQLNHTVLNDSAALKLRNITNGTAIDLVQIWNGGGEGSGWNTDSTASGFYRARAQLTDPLGNILEDGNGGYLNATYVFYVDVTPPVWHYSNASNATPAPNDLVYFSANWTENLGLASWQFYWRVQGDPLFTMQDSGTFGGTYNWSVASKTIPSAAEGKLIEYYFKATDVQGAVGTSETGNISVRDITDPVISSPAVTPIKVYLNQSVNISATITDNTFVDSAWSNITRPDNTSQVIYMSNRSSIFSALFSNTSLVGRYNVTLHANDTYGNLAAASSLYFDVYGRSDASFVRPIGGAYPYNSTLELVCLVRDHNTSSPIEGYAVDFYVNNSFIGTNRTNSTGLAVFIWNVTGIGRTALNCTISNAPALYYDVNSGNANSSIIILVPNVTLASVTHWNNASYGIDEYETFDIIRWVNVTANNTGGAIAADVRVRLDAIDPLGQPASWLAGQENLCGSLPAGSVCTTQFNNSGQGYNITSISGAGHHQWNMTFNWTNGGAPPINLKRDFMVYHLPGNMTASLNSSEVTPGGSARYIINLTNPWTKNLTGVNVTINCPAAAGLSCTCGTQAGAVCIIGDAANRTLRQIVFNISTTVALPIGDYGINFTIEYVNPGRVNHGWAQLYPAILKVKPLVAKIAGYPLDIARGDVFNLTGYASNIGAAAITGVTLNWTLPSGWTNISGSLDMYMATLAGGDQFWNNITVNTSLASGLGPQIALLETYSPDANYDDDTATIIVYGRTNITNISVSSQNPYRGEYIFVWARLQWDNSSGLPNQSVYFQSTNANTTNSTGFAVIRYQIPAWAPLGDNTFQINITYPGNGTIYSLGSAAYINVSVQDRINITTDAEPPVTGYGQKVRISANITGGIPVGAAKANITTPGGTNLLLPLYYTSPAFYTNKYNSTWSRGAYNFTVIANNTGGFSNESLPGSFEIRANATLNVTTVYPLYGGNKIVNLSSSDLSNRWWNSSFLYRKRIDITENSGSDLPLYQVNLSINTSGPVAGGRMNANCSDLRFADNDSVELNYFLESGCNTSSTLVWVRMNLSSGKTSPVYMYYGYARAANRSNGTQTFDYFDEGDQLSSWTLAGTSGQSGAQGDPIPSYYAASVNGNYMYRNIGLTTGRIVDFNVRSDGLGNFYFLANAAGAGQHFRAETRGGNNAGIAAATSWTAWAAPTGCANVATNTWHSFRLVIGTSTSQAYVNGAACGGAYTFSNNGGYIGLIGDGLGAGYTTWWDNMKVRRYASALPTYSVGSEEQYSSESLSSLYDTGNTNISGYLIMSVERNDSGVWTFIENVVNDTKASKMRNISSMRSLDVATIWNGPGEGAGFNTLARQTAQYRVSAGLSDPFGNILTSDDGTDIRSYGYFMIDATNPIVTLQFPLNNTMYSYYSINFTYIPNDSSLQNCSLWGNWSSFGWHLNETNTSPSAGQANVFGPKDLPDGFSIWTVECYDALGNFANGGIFTVIIDTTPPGVSLQSPVNAENISSGIVNFTWIASDNYAELLNCSLYLNDQELASGINSTRGAVTSYVTAVGIGGMANWTVNCSDSAGNSFKAAPNNITVVTAPLYITINISQDNVSLDLNWSNESYAISYNVYISDNYSQGFPQTPDVTGIITLNWTDLSAGEASDRYYRIAAVRGNAVAVSQSSVGRSRRPLYAGWNLASVPFVQDNWLLGDGANGGRDIFTEPAGCLISLWRYNITNQSFERADYDGSYWNPAPGFELFTALEPARGYWFETAYSCNVSFYGYVPHSNLTVRLNQTYNQVGWYSQKARMLDGVLDTPINTTPENSVSIIYRYSNAKDDFDISGFLEGYGWWPAFTSPDFTMIEPFTGYYFDAAQDSEWNINPEK